MTDALGQVTSYSYDELGNRISQTDASLHATTYGYDQLGRRVKRTLPLGQFETYSYNTVGTLQSKTDFNGKTTTYAYDNANRLLSKTPDASFNAQPVTFTYNALGQRLTMVDASGTTTYAYDGVNRLRTKTTPQGVLNYRYDSGSNLTTLFSSNASGVSTNYTYDALNRMASVTAISDSGFTFTLDTNYTYDAVGNLATVTYPNNVKHTYSYNSLNRLTNLAVAKTTPATAQANYAYTLGAAGNRLSVGELSGRTVSYGYDDLYRLTSETIACGAAAPGCVQQGTIGDQYDSVGNRKSLSSTVPAIPAGTIFYDANDRISTDQYDSNGNTVSSGGIGNVYDFENRLVQHGSVTIVYDGDGNRVAKTAGGVTTKYLVDTNSPTGYAQVLEELVSGTVVRKYTYGLSLISKRETTPSSLRFYSYDGHGSVRQLTDQNGNVTDSYDYDAFGNLINSTGTTINNYLFAGEQYDPDLGLYYNRARYLDERSGRFWGMDTYEGNLFEPTTLHKYLFCSTGTLNCVDKSGRESIGEQLTAIAGIATIAVQSIATQLATAFEEGGPAVGRFFNLLGAQAQNLGRQVLALNPNVIVEDIQDDVQVAESGTGQVIDFGARGLNGAKALIEAKYGLPYRVGPAMTRLVAQVNNGISSGRGQVVLWTLKTPTLAQVSLVLRQLGDAASEVQIVSGVEGLYNWLNLYFRPF